jgi:AcrR family transcriptional regulator
MAKVRDAERTRSEILRAAFGEVHHHGFQATSVNDIVSRANVTKGAFFHYFPTKNDLGYALTDEILKGMMLDRWIKPLNAYRNPVQGMIRTYRKLMEETTDEDLALGCPLNNLTQEMSAVDSNFRDRLQGVLELWIGETEKHLRRAKAGGYIRPEVDVRMAAQFAVMTEEGSAALVKNLGDRRVYWNLYEGFRLFFESISAKPNETA